MQPVPRVIVDAFAAAFAGKGRSSGFSAQEISDYFCAQSALVRPLEHYGIKPATKRELFVECLYSLTPEAQYCALHQLAASEHPCRNADPARARAYERHRRRRRYQPRRATGTARRSAGHHPARQEPRCALRSCLRHRWAVLHREAPVRTHAAARGPRAGPRDPGTDLGGVRVGSPGRIRTSDPAVPVADRSA
jgi:hypothetical protein